MRRIRILISDRNKLALGEQRNVTKAETRAISLIAHVPQFSEHTQPPPVQCNNRTCQTFPIAIQSEGKAPGTVQGQWYGTPQDRCAQVTREPPSKQSVQTWVTDDTVIWKEFYPGKVKKK